MRFITIVFCTLIPFVIGAQIFEISGNYKNLDSVDQVTLSLFDPILQTRTDVAVAPINTDGSYSLSFEFNQPDLYRLSFPEASIYLTVGYEDRLIKVN